MFLLTSVAAGCFRRIENGNKLQQGKQRRAGTVTGTFVVVKRYNIITDRVNGDPIPNERS